jgi:hypothetical protein
MYRSPMLCADSLAGGRTLIGSTGPWPISGRSTTIQVENQGWSRKVHEGEGSEHDEDTKNFHSEGSGRSGRAGALRRAAQDARKVARMHDTSTLAHQCRYMVGASIPLLTYDQGN